MALFGHAAAGAACPLLRDERTYLQMRRRSENDPERTLRCVDSGATIAIP